MQAEVLGEVTEAVQMRAGVAAHAEDVHRRGHAVPVHHVPVLADHLVQERGMRRDVRHARKELHAQIENFPAAQNFNHRVRCHAILLCTGQVVGNERIVGGQGGSQVLWTARQPGGGAAWQPGGEAGRRRAAKLPSCQATKRGTPALTRRGSPPIVWAALHARQRVYSWRPIAASGAPTRSGRRSTIP